MIFLIIISWISEIFGTLFPNDSAGFIIAQAPTHPLLRLPDDVIVRKLREMSLTEILKFSLISKRCKDLVKSIQIKATFFHVFIGNSINVFIKTNSKYLHLNFYVEPDMYWGTGAYGRKKKLTAPESVVAVEYNYTDPGKIEYKWEKNDLTMQYWFKHLQDIFNCHKIDVIRFSDNSSQFDIDDLKQVLGNTTKVNIENTGCYTFNQMILQKF
ncbi:unnamed protein product [Caenorhabditis brenneri]